LKKKLTVKFVFRGSNFEPSVKSIWRLSI